MTYLPGHQPEELDWLQVTSPAIEARVARAERKVARINRKVDRLVTKAERKAAKCKRS